MSQNAGLTNFQRETTILSNLERLISIMLVAWFTYIAGALDIFYALKKAIIIIGSIRVVRFREQPVGGPRNDLYNQLKHVQTY